MTSTLTLIPATELAQHDRRFPNDSDDCRKARLARLAEEIDLRRHIERVAELGATRWAWKPLTPDKTRAGRPTRRRCGRCWI